MRSLPLAALLFVSSLPLFAGCRTTDDAEAGGASSAKSLLPPVTTLDYARGVCGECHAVESPWISLHPQSPTFLDIANRPGLSENALATWLKDAHNYPAVMDVDLGDADADALAD